MARVIVRAVPPGGFWEAGKFWPAAETQADVSDDQLDQMKRTPHLVVVVLPAGASSASDADATPAESPGPKRRRAG
jgi:hypothetical protein